MTEHDPMCPNGPGGLDQCFYCGLIAKSRADLRAKVLGLLAYHTFAADGTLDGADLVLRSDVLALLEVVA